MSQDSSDSSGKSVAEKIEDIDLQILEYTKKIKLPTPDLDLSILTTDLEKVLLKYDNSDPRQQALFDLLNYYAENVVSQVGEYDLERGQSIEVSRPLGDYEEYYDEDQAFKLVYPAEKKDRYYSKPGWVEIYYGMGSKTWGLNFKFDSRTVTYKLNPKGFSIDETPITDSDAIKTLSEYVSKRIVPLLRFNMKNHMLLWTRSGEDKWVPYLHKFIGHYHSLEWNFSNFIEKLYMENGFLYTLGYYKNPYIDVPGQYRQKPLRDVVESKFRPIKQLFEEESIKTLNLPLSRVSQFEKNLYEDIKNLTDVVNDTCIVYQKESPEKVSRCLGP